MLTSPERLLRDHYDRVYRREKSDSPEGAMVAVIREARRVIRKSMPGLILDLGSGPQILARQLRSNGLIERATRVVSLDFATIPPQKLLERKASGVNRVDHLQADARTIPLADQTVDLVISNMALDLMGKRAFLEAHRVLARGGTAIASLHHPDLIPTDLDQKLSRRRRYSLSPRKRRVLSYWQHLRDNHVLFPKSSAVEQAFEEAGFRVEEVRLEEGMSNKWWLARLRRD